jgi:hypothetical protein
MGSENESFARITVATDGVWRAQQVAEALTTLDRLTCRIATVSMLTEICRTYDYVISNLRVLGLLKRGDAQRWSKPAGPMEELARTDYVEFISMMRRYGVEVEQTPVTLKFSLAVSDLMEVVPESSRLEIESLSMASPGKWLLTVSGALARKVFLAPAQQIFDALFFHRETRARKSAEAQAVLATVSRIQAEARKRDAEAGLVDAKAAQQRATALLTYSTATDSLVASLRNAGFRQADIKAMLVTPLREEIAVLTTHKCAGLITGIQIEVTGTEGSSSAPLDT